jgi:hypothetical protein
LAKDCMRCNHSSLITQTIPNHCCARLNIMHPANNFESQTFYNGWSYQISTYCIHRGPLEWHHLLIKYNEDLSSGSKVISVGHKDWWFDKPTFNFWKG